eukprot:TRINITY_DN4538_c0_g1_i1.p2 TRINITY_DN4538_c0_g1~~TRINITY_DN4538_c0_g1_i1.p2  ORF type:complete len:100 (-),score=34.22 TRINITY_DN4538_c0_g1_i1:269-529(-)
MELWLEYVFRYAAPDVASRVHDDVALALRHASLATAAAAAATAPRSVSTPISHATTPSIVSPSPSPSMSPAPDAVVGAQTTCPPPS